MHHLQPQPIWNGRPRQESHTHGKTNHHSALWVCTHMAFKRWVTALRMLLPYCRPPNVLASKSQSTHSLHNHQTHSLHNHQESLAGCSCSRLQDPRLRAQIQALTVDNRSQDCNPQSATLGGDDAAHTLLRAVRHQQQNRAQK